MSTGFGSNCYIVQGKGTVLVDAGINPANVLQKLDELGITIDTLINTHCHYDHIGGDPVVQEKTKCKIAMHELDADAVENLADERILASFFSDEAPSLKVDLKLKDKEKISGLEVIHTPGHTPGSICLYDKKTKSLFSGDTVFSDGVGRTDFPGGDIGQLKNSIEKLLKFGEVKNLYPGHGPIGDSSDIQRIYNMLF